MKAPDLLLRFTDAVLTARNTNRKQGFASFGQYVVFSSLGCCQSTSQTDRQTGKQTGRQAGRKLDSLWGQAPVGEGLESV